MTTEYVCVDVETTGLNPKADKLIEIGAVKVKDGIVVETFQSFVNPNAKLPERIVDLTGITDEMILDAPQAKDVMPLFHAFCEELPLMGHNLQVDYAFLKRAMVQEGLSFEKRGIDTLKIARKYLADLEKRSLEFLCNYFAIEHTAHRALGDAAATAQLYELLKDKFYEKAVEEKCSVFLPKQLLHQAKKEQSITIAQKEQIAKYCEKLHIVLEQDIETMTRAEASRFIQRYHLAFKGLQK